jgi:hypothetical protein
MKILMQNDAKQCEKILNEKMRKSAKWILLRFEKRNNKKKIEKAKWAHPDPAASAISQKETQHSGWRMYNLCKLYSTIRHDQKFQNPCRVSSLCLPFSMVTSILQWKGVT